MCRRKDSFGGKATPVLAKRHFWGEETPVPVKRHFWGQRDTCFGEETLLEEKQVGEETLLGKKRHLCWPRDTFDILQCRNYFSFYHLSITLSLIYLRYQLITVPAKVFFA
jgi:hypothetical protein